MEELLLVFDDTRGAIQGEQALGAAGVPVRVMSLPSAIRAGCGLCLRVAPGDGARAVAVLAQRGFAPSGTYRREAGANGTPTYRATEVSMDG